MLSPNYRAVWCIVFKKMTVNILCHTYRDLREVNGGNKNFHCGEANKGFRWPHDFFSLVKIYRISILIGYTVFPTSEENRIVILLTTWLLITLNLQLWFSHIPLL